MCEPAHSICQFPTTDPETGDPTPVGSFLGEWMKKIGNYFHFSRFGLGHSESIRYGAMHHRVRIPEPLAYETAWWVREVHFDKNSSRFDRTGIDLDDAFDSAKIYAERTAIGDLGMLRRFLEVSIQKSEAPNLYFGRFVGRMLNPDGRRVYHNKVVRFHRLTNQQHTSLILGLTRKRELLVPAWADDEKLWTPKKGEADAAQLLVN